MARIDLNGLAAHGSALPDYTQLRDGLARNLLTCSIGLNPLKAKPSGSHCRAVMPQMKRLVLFQVVIDHGIRGPQVRGDTPGASGAADRAGKHTLTMVATVNSLECGEHRRLPAASTALEMAFSNHAAIINLRTAHASQYATDEPSI